ITTTPDGSIDFCNHAAAMILGKGSDAVLGATLAEIFAFSPEETNQLQGGAESGHGSVTPLFKQVYLDGRKKVIAFTLATMKGEGGEATGNVLVFRDITELRRTETALRHAHKMEAIGTLAGGIAHEFNNVLGIILGNVEMAMEDFEEPPLMNHLAEIRGACFRAGEIVRQLLNFSRKLESDKRPVAVEEVISETMKLIRASLPATIAIDYRPLTEVKPIVADTTQLHQVMFNLCNNAAHAMAKDGGELLVTLETRAVQSLEASFIQDLHEGEYTVITVRDSGVGIPVENLEKIFDPYFTTKQAGQGTGMGLSVVHTIIRNHGGAIVCQSTEGEYTQFVLYFPVSEGSPEVKLPVLADLPTGTESIMLVDDEVSLTTVGKLLLEKLGYHVTVFNQPSLALQALTDAPADYDLVITDMTMPEMTGDRLAAKMWEVRPELPVVLCTGYTDRLSREDALRLGMKEYLPKPFDKFHLAQVIRKHLDAAS
ncbi:response regulator, partial [Myxococcota bacterium]|nr:response regulator [Myxococcota bacterium]